MSRFITTTALALLAVSGLVLAPASAQAPDALIAEITQMAVEAGVPAEPLLAKVREGRAKGVPDARIHLAVSALRTRLVQARGACGEGGDLLCLQAAADALANGFSAVALSALVERSATDKTSPARILVALTAVRARGLAPQASVDRVQQALEAGDLDALLPAAAGDPTVDGAAWGPPAVGRDGELPVQNPTRDRDQTGKGKAWGRGKTAPGRPPGAGPPDEAGPPDGAGRPDEPGRSGDAPGQP